LCSWSEDLAFSCVPPWLSERSRYEKADISIKRKADILNKRRQGCRGGLSLYASTAKLMPLHPASLRSATTPADLARTRGCLRSESVADFAGIRTSPPIALSKTGARSSTTTPSPPPSSTGSSTIPTSRRLRVLPIASKTAKTNEPTPRNRSSAGLLHLLQDFVFMGVLPRSARPRIRPGTHPSRLNGPLVIFTPAKSGEI